MWPKNHFSVNPLRFKMRFNKKRRQDMRISRAPSSLNRRGFLSGMVAAACGAPAWAQAPAWPTRPVQLIVAAPPGGPSDAFARMLAEDMARTLGQPMVIDNRPGAGGVVAVEALMRAVPDGHTVLMSSIGNTTAPGLLPRVGYDFVNDLVHVTQLMAGSNVLVAHPSTGFKTLADMLKAAKARPGQLTYASAGNGSSGHLAIELLKQRAGVSILHIPYRGGAPALNDLLGGQVDLLVINQDAVIPHAKAGRLVPLAITSPTRIKLFPDLHTMAESGFPGFEATAWAGLTVPRGTPAHVVDRLRAAALSALQGAVGSKQDAVGAMVVGSSPAQFTEFVRRETEKWTKVIRNAGIKSD
jgi:tripartite-type tricarboxylate transporter receptor subunit TctC